MSFWVFVDPNLAEDLSANGRLGGLQDGPDFFAGEPLHEIRRAQDGPRVLLPLH